MNKKLLIPIFLLTLTGFFINVSGQNAVIPTVADTFDSLGTPNLLTIVYNIEVKSNKHKTGIEETYNGGIKTIFIDNDKARVRLVSLMRIQSIFFSDGNKSSHPVSIVKESGKKKYKYYLTNEQWDLYNKKYENDSCQLTSDSAIILNYPCRKAIITLKDGRTLVAYYTNQLKSINKKIEPAFSCIPGLVLQYQYEYKKGTIVYTADKISLNNIAGNIFRVPSKGYALKKYFPTCRAREKSISEGQEIN